MSEDILEIAKEYLSRVKPSGPNDIMAICPFHRKADGSEENTGSFAMNIYNGLWYCHSCHSRGNLFTFLRDMGVGRTQIDLIYKSAIDEAQRYSPKKYNPLKGTAATKETLEERFLGTFDYCPLDLLNEGYPQELLRKFGVGFDVDHKRITFPLRDVVGRLVGISGRAVEDGQVPRYKVYDKEYIDFGMAARETQKRAILWNASAVIAQLMFEKDPSSRFVVVTEGFKAVMRVDQAGISNVVGLLGSYMSTEQQEMLEEMGCTVLLMLDNNDAGRKGQIDAGQRLTKTVPHVFAVPYDAPQPSDLESQAILQAIASSQPFVSWYSQQAIAKYAF